MCCVVGVVVIFIVVVFQLNCSLGLWSFSLNTSWWIEVTLEIRKKEVGLFFVWLQRLLMTEFNTTFPTILCIFPSLLQFIPPSSEKASTFTLQKICSHFYFVPSPISTSFFSSWPSPSFRPQLKPLWRHCGVVNCGIEKVRPLTEKHFFDYGKFHT